MATKPPIIHVTQDYNKFKKLSYNRAVNHTRKLFEVIDNCNKLYLHPIIVTPEFKIIDGQHRWEYAQQRQVPLYYIVDNDFSPVDLIAHNTAASNWTPMNFAKFFMSCDGDIISAETKESYKLMLLLNEKYNLPFDATSRLYIAQRGINRECRSLSKSFREGKLELRFPYHIIITSAEKISAIMKFIHSQKISKRFDCNTIKAFHLISDLEGYDEEKFLNKIDSNLDDLVTALKFKKADEIFTRLLSIYNKNSKNKLQGNSND